MAIATVAGHIKRYMFKNALPEFRYTEFIPKPQAAVRIPSRRDAAPKIDPILAALLPWVIFGQILKPNPDPRLYVVD